MSRRLSPLNAKILRDVFSIKLRIISFKNELEHHQHRYHHLFFVVENHYHHLVLKISCELLIEFIRVRLPQRAIVERINLKSQSQAMRETK